MAGFMSSWMSSIIIILTLTICTSLKTEADALLADPGGTAAVLNVSLLTRNASESGYINLVFCFHGLFRWSTVDTCDGERRWISRKD
jgi:hypothetical protein